MKLARLALLGLVLGLVIDVASAANAGLVAANLQAGSAAITACGSTAGTSMSYTIDGAGRVTAVVVSGLPAGCVGGKITATLVNNASAVQGSGGPVTIAGAAANIPVAATPPATAVARTEFVVIGP